MATTRWLTMLVWLASSAFAEEGPDAVWQAMEAPGSVIVLRHSYAPGSFDPPGARLDDCSTQRNLDERGRAQARAIGEAFRRRGMTVGPVLSSPRCRCIDTGRLAFGSAQPWAPLQGALADDVRRRQVAEIRKAIAAHQGGSPLVLVAHGIVVTDLTGVNIQMGEMAVLRRGPDGVHTVAGRLYIE